MVKNQKYINALFLGAGILVWYVSKRFIEVWVGYFQLGRTLGGTVDLLIHGLPILLALGVFLILRANSGTYNFSADAVGEMIRVVWPSKKDVRVGTIVVIITVIMAGILLGLVDMLFTWVIRSLIGT